MYMEVRKGIFSDFTDLSKEYICLYEVQWLWFSERIDTWFLNGSQYKCRFIIVVG